MKINITDELRKESLLGHVVLHGISIAANDISGELAEEGRTENGVELDVVMTVNGREVDIKDFVDHWQSEVSDIIKAEVKKVIDQRFNDVSEMLFDLQERVKPEIQSRLEDWELPDESNGPR